MWLYVCKAKTGSTFGLQPRLYTSSVCDTQRRCDCRMRLVALCKMTCIVPVVSISTTKRSDVDHLQIDHICLVSAAPLRAQDTPQRAPRKNNWISETLCFDVFFPDSNQYTAGMLRQYKFLTSVLDMLSKEEGTDSVCDY